MRELSYLDPPVLPASDSALQDSTCRQVWKRWSAMGNLQSKPYVPSVGRVGGRTVWQTTSGTGGLAARAPPCAMVPSAASGAERASNVEQSVGVLVVDGKSTIELGVPRALLGEGRVREGIESALSAAFTSCVEFGRTRLGGWGELSDLRRECARLRAQLGRFLLWSIGPFHLLCLMGVCF